LAREASRWEPPEPEHAPAAVETLETLPDAAEPEAADDEVEVVLLGEPEAGVPDVAFAQGPADGEPLVVLEPEGEAEDEVEGEVEGDPGDVPAAGRAGAGAAAAGFGHVITVASATGGCGKTFYATNLAAALAEAGHRVVLVDLDLQF